jgi:pyrroline-5-carboxylate reductase
MVRFLAARGHQITVSDRNAQVAASLNASHGVTVAANQDVIDTSDIVFLCVRPNVAADALAPLSFRSDHQVISVMAGISLADLREACAPATDITLTIPLGFLEQGGCPLPACPNDSVLAPLFAPENPVLPVSDEDAFNQHFAICAMVPGVLDLMVTGSDWLAHQTGDADGAALYTRHLLAGFLASLPDGSASVLPTERDALATDGTLSLQMTTALQDGRAHEALVTALNAIGDRLGGRK